MKKLANISMGYSFEDNSLADDIAREKEAELKKAQEVREAKEKLLREQAAKREAGIDDILSKIDQKLNSAKSKFAPSFGKAKPKTTFQPGIVDEIKEDTPQTAKRSNRSVDQRESIGATPASFTTKATFDDAGNRVSIGQERQSTESFMAPAVPKKTQLEQLQSQSETPGKFVERKNFVKMNMQKAY